jgi:type II secretory pathway component PulC
MHYRTMILAFAVIALPINYPLAQTSPVRPTPRPVSTAATTELDKISLLAIGVTDNRAVLLLSDKRMVMLKTGDSLPGMTVTLTKIMADKVVLEETRAGNKQVVWMHKAVGDVPGRVERFTNHVEPAPTQHSAFNITPVGKSAVSAPIEGSK